MDNIEISVDKEEIEEEIPNQRFVEEIENDYNNEHNPNFRNRNSDNKTFEETGNFFYGANDLIESESQKESNQKFKLDNPFKKNISDGIKLLIILDIQTLHDKFEELLDNDEEELNKVEAVVHDNKFIKQSYLLQSYGNFT